MVNYIIKDFNKSNNKASLSYIIKSYFSSRAKQAVILYRLSNYFYRKNYKIISKIICNHNIKSTGFEIGQECCIEEGLYIGHSNGIVISGNAIIGKNLTIMQQVTIGSSRGKKNMDKTPRIGDNVFLGAGSKILGAEIGNNSIIGANTVVVKDVPDCCTVVGNPAYIIKRNGMTVYEKL